MKATKREVDNLMQEIYKFEKRFLTKNYNGRGLKSFVIEEGNIPIMISAPHAVNHYRDKKVKYADILTGGIARYLQKVTGCHLIYSAKQINQDPNYDQESKSEYKIALKKYVEENKIKVLIDLHGASQEREYAVEMGTTDDSDKSLHEHKFIADLIKYHFTYYFRQLNGKTDIWKNKIFAASYENTITNYISEKTDTACIQLEVNGQYRNLDNAEDVSCLVLALKAIIDSLSKIDWEVKNIKVFKAAKAADHFPQDCIQISDEKDKLLSGANIGLMCLNGNTEFVHMKSCSTNTKKKHIHLENKENEYVFLTNRLIGCILGNECLENNKEEQNLEGRPVIVYEYKGDVYKIGKPLADKIDSVMFSEKLYDKLKPLSRKYNYIIYNRYTDTKMYIDFAAANYDDDGRVDEEKIMIPRYYRRLLGYLDYPLLHIQEDAYIQLKKKITDEAGNGKDIEDIINCFDEYYNYVKEDRCYILKEGDDKSKEERLGKIQKKYIENNIELLKMPKCEGEGILKKSEPLGKKIMNKFLKTYVGYSESCLRVIRTEEVDDKNNVARISTNLMNLLGVSEYDKIVIKYGNKKEKIRVLKREGNEDYYIGIPASARKRLGMNSANDIVTVQRDMGYALKRNSLQQGLTILGTVIAVFEVFKQAKYGIIASIVFVPIMLYLVLSEERVRVK